MHKREPSFKKLIQLSTTETNIKKISSTLILEVRPKYLKIRVERTKIQRIMESIHLEKLANFILFIISTHSFIQTG